jgi:hypothetical protein
MTRSARLARAGLLPLLLVLAARVASAQEGAAAALGLDSLLNVPISASGTYPADRQAGAQLGHHPHPRGDGAVRPRPESP